MDSQRVLHFIEDTVQDIEEQLALRPAGKPSITLNRITGLRPHDDAQNGEGAWVAREHQVTYSFPGKTKEEAWRFGTMLSCRKSLLIMQPASFESSARSIQPSLTTP